VPDEAIPTIIDPAATFGDTITVKTSQVVAYQQRMEKRIRNQAQAINRLLKQIEELEEIQRRDADEIARLSRAVADEQVLYQEQKALLDRARAERDELLSTFSGMMVWLKDRGHTREGLVWTTTDLPRTDVDAEWHRVDLEVPDPENEVREAVSKVLPVGEQRPGKHLAGE
jgi:hypothetical protein